MADAICRWRNPYIHTVFELIKWLPKYEQSEENARAFIQQSYGGDFFKTPYQLACQLGLYYITDGYYFPKFSYIPTEEELKKYLENWLIHYTSPNPYTPSITHALSDTVEPFSIHKEVCQKLFEAQEEILWVDTLNEIFGMNIGNLDILRNTFNSYSPVLDIKKNNESEYIISLKSNLSYCDLDIYRNIIINLDRNDKEGFFDFFRLPNELDSFTNSSLLVTDEENKILSDLESSDLSQTEKYQIAKSRIGQGKFRRLLIEEGMLCPFTQVDDLGLLVASHIKPWSVSSNSERLNPKNGLLLTPTYDKLFDRGFISFTENKELMISSRLDRPNILRLGLELNNVVSSLNLEGREQYFDYHRREVFRV